MVLPNKHPVRNWVGHRHVVTTVLVRLMLLLAFCLKDIDKEDVLPEMIGFLSCHNSVLIHTTSSIS